MLIRRAVPSDIPQIRSLEQQSPSAAHWTAAQYESCFSLEAAERVVFVALRHSDQASLDGFLVARCLNDAWEIENVVVSTELLREGIARSLIQQLKATAIGAASSIILEVRESNLPAMRLYESIGFKEEGRRKDYYQNPSEGAVLYRLPLQLCDKIY